ncbi:MAG: hypothetical protein EOM50_17930 [Erysipelotrichia bacterium]|jgi:hypothetical protein|nr:hypothetical protein [Erysipelotrichia bacterium]
MKKIFIFVWLTSSILLSNDCIQANLISPTPFMGNNGEIFKLDNGVLGEVKFEYEYMYEYYPNVIICPSQNKLIINSKSLRISIINMPTNIKNNTNKQNSSNIIETFIDGDFNGWEGNTIVKLQNGQIWQQSSYIYYYHYSYNSKVMIIKTGSLYKMQIDGVPQSAYVIRLK